MRARNALLAGCAVALAACGDPDTSTQTTQAPARHVPRAVLMPGWALVTNARAGFTFGLPPGWGAQGSQTATLVRSPNRAVAGGVSADRSQDGRDLDLASYARRTVGRLPGYRQLRPGEPRPLRGAKYPATVVRATGRFRTGVRQAIVVYTIRDPAQATFTLAFFRNASSPAAVYDPAIAEVARTFRARPREH